MSFRGVRLSGVAWNGRKSVIGLSLDLPSDQRMEGTLATTVMWVSCRSGICACA